MQRRRVHTPPPRSIDRVVRSMVRWIGRSFDRWFDRARVRSRSPSCTAPYFIFIYTYITINIPYQYTHHRLNPHTHTPVLDRVFLSSLSFHVNRRLVSSRHSTRRRRLSIEWRRSTTSETTTIPIPILVFTRVPIGFRVRRWTRTIARARGFERRLSTTRRRRRATDRRRRNVDDRG